jgi:hypothetical protein
MMCERCGSEIDCRLYAFEVICDNCCEKEYERQQEKLMEDGPDTSIQERQDQDLRDAGRGHLVRS